MILNLSEKNNNEEDDTNETLTIDTQCTDFEDYLENFDCDDSSKGSDSEETTSDANSDCKEITSDKDINSKENLDEEIANEMKMMTDEEIRIPNEKIRIADVGGKDYSYLKEYVNKYGKEVEELVFIEFVNEDKTSSIIGDSKSNLLN